MKQSLHYVAPSFATRLLKRTQFHVEYLISSNTAQSSFDRASDGKFFASIPAVYWEMSLEKDKLEMESEKVCEKDG